MKAWLIVLGLFVLVGLGIVFLMIGIPMGLIILGYINTPTDTTTTTSFGTHATTTTTISPSTLAINPIDGAECTVDEYCDIPVAEATGGQEPYSYQSDSYAAGAPPMGMIVDLNGRLTGTPKRAGEYDVGVCVADATRLSKCTQAKVSIKEKQAPVVDARASINSFSCKFKYKDTYGDKHYELSASGTATAPDGAELQLVFNPGYYTKKSAACPECSTYCGSWDDSRMQSCEREGGSDNTVWEVHVPASQVISGATLEAAGYQVTLYARIFMGGNTITEDVAYATCPR
jgi:hypothetical protein